LNLMRETLGDLYEMTTPEKGWWFLRALAVNQQAEFAIPDMVTYMESSARKERGHIDTRNGVAVSGSYRHYISQILADAVGWLISRGLVGPGSASSRSGGEWRVTTAGYDALTNGSVLIVENRQRLHTDLHHALEGSPRRNFETGDYNVAVFAAMHAVENAVRTAGGLTDSVHGDALMKEAFKENGPLAPRDVNRGEQVALMSLFAGAYGAFRNPAAHRPVEYKSATEAADILHLADLLLRIADRQAIEFRARVAAPETHSQALDEGALGSP
jgi:uncharacterized protein (TIGR02391 family)